MNRFKQPVVLHKSFIRICANGKPCRNRKTKLVLKFPKMSVFSAHLLARLFPHILERYCVRTYSYLFLPRKNVFNLAVNNLKFAIQLSKLISGNSIQVVNNHFYLLRDSTNFSVYI